MVGLEGRPPGYREFFVRHPALSIAPAGPWMGCCQWPRRDTTKKSLGGGNFVASAVQPLIEHLPVRPSASHRHAYDTAPQAAMEVDTIDEPVTQVRDNGALAVKKTR